AQLELDRVFQRLGQEAADALEDGILFGATHERVPDFLGAARITIHGDAQPPTDGLDDVLLAEMSAGHGRLLPEPTSPNRQRRDGPALALRACATHNTMLMPELAGGGARFTCGAASPAGAWSIFCDAVLIELDTHLKNALSCSGCSDFSSTTVSVTRLSRL